MSKVISFAEFNERRNEKKDKEEDVLENEMPIEKYLRQVSEANKAKEERLKKERAQNNRSITRNYRLKK